MTDTTATEPEETDVTDLEYVGDAPLAPTKGPERILVSLKSLVKPIEGLEHWPGNANVGDVEFVAQSLQANGQFRPILVQKSTGRVVYGNHTLRAARDLLGWTKIAHLVQDLTDEQARRIAIADNESSRRARWDNDALVKELQLLNQTDHDLVGTGFDQPALDGLLEQLQGAGGAAGPIAPSQFGAVDPDALKIEHKCPRCGYEWSGNAS